MKNEKAHRRRALFAMEAIAVCATSCRKEWKGRTPPTIEEVDAAIRKLSYWARFDAVANQHVIFYQ